MFILNVPFEEKDEAKPFGAKWNPGGRYWYYPGDVLPQGLRRWYNGADDDAPEATDEVGDGDAGNAALENNQGVIEGYEQYMSVTAADQLISDKFGETIEFQAIMVMGEVTDYRGHTEGNNYYFSIKDDRSILPCFMYEWTAITAMNFELEAGQQVALIGKLDMYSPTGKVSLKVRRIENIGAGAANLALMQLKARLEEEGLFDEDHKKPIPKYPEKVGVITSRDGQAIKDICKVAKKRNPYVQLVLYHVNVQGVNAVPSILQGIAFMDTQGYDSIIIGRGGGSDEELKAYNDEGIARAVYAMETPVISAVGHEGNWTLIDYVSDKRVATPTEAAEEALPNVMVDVNRLKQLRDNLDVNIRNAVERRKYQLQVKLSELEKNSPERRLKDRTDRLNILSERLKDNMNKLFDAKKHRFEVLLANLNGLSPTAKLISGFGYISHDNKPVRNVADVKKGDTLMIKIHDGEITADVTGISEQNI